ncbi:ABC transporter substrate-binding protein [Paenibacillus sacheonensis]|uniref:Extracellular solute-binding protein n=1 Tax=Paenibacillus sacheonensis TaxID=742054 RepID=A0A7X4YVH2_9BACL|nr:sugar ABC transporter substrate-binding protein [Paenibacillus sacheonensis]MBM7568541.1 multiple sugar transport system substrate-binding protein [Paenibacillus sacheonensis]NBC72366.1 extracellular solute-binding protein [Paenibacillus sacheonensis]
MNKMQKGIGGAAALLLLSQLVACGDTSGNGNGSIDGASVTTTGEKTNEGAKAEQVTLRIMDWSDSIKSVREEFHRKFMEKHPNIKIEYTQLTIDQFKNTILTAVKSGEAPDLFPVPTGMKLSALVKDGWFQPLDPYIDQSFKDQFIDGTFQNGTTVVDGKIYSIPEAEALPSSLLFYNKKLFREAGLDPENPPKTYSEFREAAKKITEAGKGKYYGIIEGGKQNNRWLTTAKEWSSLAGAGLNGNSPIDLATGKATYDSEAVQGVFSLFAGLRDDNSFHPNTMSISAPEARALFGQGQAGFIVQGAWCIGVWNKDNPDLEYGVMAPPVPDSGRKGSIPITSSQPWIGLSADSKHPEEAALYLKEYYGGDFFQQERVKSGDAFSVVKGINEKYSTVEQLKQYYALAHEYGHLVPDPNIGNPEASAVFAQYKDVHPDLGELLGGTVSGAFKDFKTPLTAYSGQVDKAWTSAIDAAKKEGANVDASNFVFDNWDPMKDFLAEDYKSAK